MATCSSRKAETVLRTVLKIMAFAIGRAMDDAIISSALGTAYTGKSGSTSVTVGSDQQVGVGSPAAGLTIAKLVEAKKKLDLQDVDPSIKRYIAVGPEQVEDLLNSTTVTSSDYNTVKALVQGEINTFLGFEFIVTNRLETDSSDYRKCIAWAEDGLMLAVGRNLESRIEERADKSYSTQVWCQAHFGATRLEEEKVIQILASEA